MGTLTRKHFNITEVKRGPETKIDGTVLYIREGIEEEAAAGQELVNQLKDRYHHTGDVSHILQHNHGRTANRYKRGRV